VIAPRVSAPLILITAIGEFTGGVEGAQMVSFSILGRYLGKIVTFR